MGLLNSYAIWNNKGGVGKSTIAFHLATRYAERHARRKVLVVDLCPQSNSSMMLLGGGSGGEDAALELCQHAPTPQTVVGYIATVLSQGPGAELPKWDDFVTKVSDHNEQIPENLFLLCGDGNLEPMAPLISERAGQAALVAGANPWTWVHLIIRRFIENVAASKADEWLVLVDTNPSFSIYTEIAISSVGRLVVPVNADDASRVATRAMFTLIYGAEPPHPIYGQYTYASRAKTEEIERPIIHLIVGNRLTQYGGPAAAFKAMSDATANSLFEVYQQNSTKFTPTETEIGSVDEFRDAYSIPLRDFNTAGVVAAHLGIPLSALRAREYQVYNESVQVHSERLRECQEAVNEVVDRI